MPECLQNVHAHLTAGSLGDSWSKTNLDETVCSETISLNFCRALEAAQPRRIDEFWIESSSTRGSRHQSSVGFEPPVVIKRQLRRSLTRQCQDGILRSDQHLFQPLDFATVSSEIVALFAFLWLLVTDASS